MTLLQNMWTLLVEKRVFFFDLLVEHIEISLLAIFIAVVLGGIVGILISEFQKTAKPTLGIINFLYTIPSISMLGFLIPFSGIGNATAVIALTVYALLPMVRNTHTGISNVDENILEAAKGMGSTRTQILFKIKLPLAMPVILSGIRSMVTMTIALAGIASFIGAGGLGVAIYRGITTNNSAMTMAGSLLIALLALVFDLILGFIEKRMEKRNEKAKKANRKMAGAVIALALILLFVSVLPNAKKETIHIATKPMTEQYVLGEMLDILIEQKEAQVIFRHKNPVYVWADEFKVEQVVRNYVNNALNHVDGEKVIEIKITQENDVAKITVFNTGTPIPEEDLPHIWEKFYKVDKARTREYGGNGIGLSIVKAIMDSFHQQCGVINHEDGVEFWFELEKGKQS